MPAILAQLMVGLVAKLMTETFLARILIYSLRAWARQTENHYDNQVVEAAADALGIPVEDIKEAQK